MASLLKESPVSVLCKNLYIFTAAAEGYGCSCFIGAVLNLVGMQVFFFSLLPGRLVTFLFSFMTLGKADFV